MNISGQNIWYHLVLCSLSLDLVASQKSHTDQQLSWPCHRMYLFRDSFLIPGFLCNRVSDMASFIKVPQVLDNFYFS